MQILNLSDSVAPFRVLQSFRGGLQPGRTAVSVIAPCFNEEDGIPPLAQRLLELESQWPEYDWRFIFVDDCSTDTTAELLQRQFGGWTNAAIIRHNVNLGITGAIRSGIEFSDTEIVCSIDSDCTYDPRDLGRLVPMIAAGNDLVTASPYHPQGGVAGVPGWRLVLSKSASWLYRFVFGAQVYTFTACYRAYRRSAVVDLQVENTRYGGLAEMLLLVMIAGGRVAEFPTVLQVRQFGQSKMKVVRTIGAHLALMRRLLPVSWASPHPRAQPIETPIIAPRTVPAATPARKAA